MNGTPWETAVRWIFIGLAAIVILGALSGDSEAKCYTHEKRVEVAEKHGWTIKDKTKNKAGGNAFLWENKKRPGTYLVTEDFGKYSCTTRALVNGKVSIIPPVTEEGKLLVRPIGS